MTCAISILKAGEREDAAKVSVLTNEVNFMCFGGGGLSV